MPVVRCCALGASPSFFQYSSHSASPFLPIFLTFRLLPFHQATDRGPVLALKKSSSLRRPPPKPSPSRRPKWRCVTRLIVHGVTCCCQELEALEEKQFEAAMSLSCLVQSASEWLTVFPFPHFLLCPNPKRRHPSPALCPIPPTCHIADRGCDCRNFEGRRTTQTRSEDAASRLDREKVQSGLLASAVLCETLGTDCNEAMRCWDPDDSRGGDDSGGSRERRE